MAFLHIAWTLLNLGLTLGLFIVSYRNFRLFSERYGSLPSGLLFLLTVRMCQSPNQEQEKQTASVIERVVPLKVQKSHWSTSKAIPLLKLPSISITQRVRIDHQS